MTRCPNESCPNTMGIPNSGTHGIVNFRSAIDSQSLTDDMKLTYLKTLVTRKAKTAIAEFAYCGAMYKDILRNLERKFGRPQAVVSAHLDKLKSFPPLKIHYRDNIFNYSVFV